VAFDLGNRLAKHGMRQLQAEQIPAAAPDRVFHRRRTRQLMRSAASWMEAPRLSGWGTSMRRPSSEISTHLPIANRGWPWSSHETRMGPE